MVHELASSTSGDTFWVQARTDPVAAAGTSVQLSVTAPNTDRWNIAAVEIVSAGSSVANAPVAANDSYSTNEDTALTVAAPGVLGNDSGSATLTAVLVAGPSHGTLALNANGSFSYTPAANFNGTDGFTYKANDGTADSNVATLTISVTAVNDAPSFTKGADQTVLEDAGPQTVSGWATAISAGPVDESGQTLNFIVTTTNAALFSAQPAVSATGTLTFTPAAGPTGAATVTVQLHDNGGVANGGVDTSAAQTLTINVTAVNHAPSFTTGADQTLLEDAGPQTDVGTAATISAGPAAASWQTLNFIVTPTNAALFFFYNDTATTEIYTLSLHDALPISATVTVQLHDNGGVANGGVDTSAAQTLTISVTAVNDAPSFTKGADQTVLEDAGPQTVSGWATAISAGPVDESGQTLNFIVTTTNTARFSAQPAGPATGPPPFT